jgi:hypothetical protein
VSILSLEAKYSAVCFDDGEVNFADTYDSSMIGTHPKEHQRGNMNERLHLKYKTGDYRVPFSLIEAIAIMSTDPRSNL